MARLVEITVDPEAIRRLEQKFAQIADQVPVGVRRAVNWAGDRAATAISRALVKQTGTTYGAVIRYLRRIPASGSNLVYRINAKAPAMSLKEFSARQVKGGVSAAPWHRRQVFRRAFIGPNEHVFVRRTRKRLPLRMLWGPVLANELLRGDALQAFEQTVTVLLPDRLEHELNAILAGHAPRG